MSIFHSIFFGPSLTIQLLNTHGIALDAKHADVSMETDGEKFVEICVQIDERTLPPTMEQVKEEN